MRVAVIGAGIVGVTTAYELARRRPRGHGLRAPRQRRRARPASPMPASSRPATSRPGPRRACRWKVLRHLFSRHAPVRLAALARWRSCRWLWRWWRACRPAVHAANRARMQRLAHFSRERLQALTRDAAARLRADARLPGAAAQRARPGAGAAPAWRCCANSACRTTWSTPRAAAAIEPGLNPDTALHAGDPPAAGRRRQLPPVRAPAARPRRSASARASASTPTVRALTRRRRGRAALRRAASRGATRRSGFDAVVVCAGVQANAPAGAASA